VRVVIAEDSVLLREGLTKLLADGGFEVAAAVSDADQLLRVSHSAVEKYVSSIFAKLDLPPTDTENRRVLAVLRFLRM
jgi:DNA-binding NarL/FixJ family response regulator